MAVISQTKMEKLLSRELTPAESESYSLYLEIAQERLQDLLCLEALPPVSASFQLLLARCFDVISQEQKQTQNMGISTKKVEDFSITYGSNTETPMELFVKTNQELIAKFSECQGRMLMGDVRRDERFQCI